MTGGAVSDKSWSQGEDSWWIETMACRWLGSYLQAEKGEKIKHVEIVVSQFKATWCKRYAHLCLVFPGKASCK